MLTPSSPIESPVTKRTSDLLSYWKLIEADQAAPLTHTLDPLDFAHHLPFVGLLEPIEAGNMRFRLFGTGLTKMFGHDLTNSNMFDFIHSPIAGFGEWGFAPIEEDCVVLIAHVIMGFENDHLCTTEFIYLPYVNENGFVRRVLMSMEEIDHWPHDVRLRGELDAHRLTHYRWLTRDELRTSGNDPSPDAQKSGARRITPRRVPGTSSEE